MQQGGGEWHSKSAMSVEFSCRVYGRRIEAYLCTARLHSVSEGRACVDQTESVAPVAQRFREVLDEKDGHSTYKPAGEWYIMLMAWETLRLSFPVVARLSALSDIAEHLYDVENRRGDTLYRLTCQPRMRNNPHGCFPRRSTYLTNTTSAVSPKLNI